MFASEPPADDIDGGEPPPRLTAIKPETTGNGNTSATRRHESLRLSAAFSSAYQAESTIGRGGAHPLPSQCRPLGSSSHPVNCPGTPAPLCRRPSPPPLPLHFALCPPLAEILRKSSNMSFPSTGVPAISPRVRARMSTLRDGRAPAAAARGRWLWSRGVSEFDAIAEHTREPKVTILTVDSTIRLGDGQAQEASRQRGERYAR